jgi:hypothetical protein
MAVARLEDPPCNRPEGKGRVSWFHGKLKDLYLLINILTANMKIIVARRWVYGMNHSSEKNHNKTKSSPRRICGCGVDVGLGMDSRWLGTDSSIYSYCPGCS